ncbi:MAG: hypothetical protein IKB95_05015, partial [Bacteroidales bacterium]|nr:hypothetical protein [Bacteroidales bacterium]
FNFKRFWNIVKYELFQFYQLYSVWIVIIGVIFVFIPIISAYLLKGTILLVLPSCVPVYMIFTLSLYRQGVFFPKSFDKGKVMNFLLFPGTVYEKFFAKLLLFFVIPYLFCAAIISLCPLSPGDLIMSDTLSPLAIRWKLCGRMYFFSIFISSLAILGGNLGKMKERIIAIISLFALMIISKSVSTPIWFHNISGVVYTSIHEVPTLSEWLFVAITLVIAISVSLYKRKCLTINS